MKKILFHQCKKCGYDWQEELNDVYKTGKLAECPVCHNQDSKIKFTRITNVDNERKETI